MLVDIAEEAMQLEASERLPEGIDLDTLRKHFTLTTEDLEEVEQCRGAINKLGFAVQLCTLRWQGYFLRDTCGVPEMALEIVASQLGLLAIPIEDYPQNEKTRWEHLERIRQHLGFSRCDDTQRQRLLDHLVEMAQGLPRSTALRQEACRWLQTQKIVRPGRTTLRDIITAAREAALQQVYSLLFDRLAPGQREQIDALLVVPAAPETAACTEIDSPSRSRLEQYKTLPREESPEAVLAVLERLVAIGDLGLAILPVLAEVHPATRRLLANCGYHYEVWSLRRFAPPKRYAIVLCFLQSALGETTDAIVEMQDKLITAIHNKARERREDRLLATDEARRRAVEVLEELGTLVLDTSIPDEKLRERIFAQLPSADIDQLVIDCRQLQAGDDGSHLGFVTHWYGYTRKYSPQLLEIMPFQFAQDLALGQAVTHLKEINRDQKRKLTAEAPTSFLPRRWMKYVIGKDKADSVTISRPYYEMALLTTLNERIKSGDVTVAHSRRWTDFENYLIPRTIWDLERKRHYASLSLPLDVEVYLAKLKDHLAAVTTEVDSHMPGNAAVTINAEKG